MADQRNKVLLGIAAVLAVLRFGIVPWIDSQAQARERLQVLTQRLDRSVGVVQNRKAILDAQKTLRAASARAHGRFPAAPSAEAFRLDNQRRIGAIVTASGAQLALFDWLLEGRLKDTDLSYGRVRFQVDGPLRDVVRAHAELEGNLPSLVVREVQLNLSSPAAGPDEARTTMTVIGDLFFRQQGKSP